MLNRTVAISRKRVIHSDNVKKNTTLFEMIEPMCSVYCACMLKLRMSNRPLFFCTKVSTPDQLWRFSLSKMDCWLRKCGGCRTKTGRYLRDRRGNAGAFQTRNDWQKNIKEKQPCIHFIRGENHTAVLARVSDMEMGSSECRVVLRGGPSDTESATIRHGVHTSKQEKKIACKPKRGELLTLHIFFFAILLVVVALKATPRPRRPVHSIPCAVSCFVCCHTVLCERHQRRIWR